MKTLTTREESAVAIEDVPKPELLKNPERGKENVSGQICPSHCTQYYYTPPCPTKK